MPFILAGDFNVNLASPKNAWFTNFLKDFFDVKRASQDIVPTAKSGSVIDHFFVRGTRGFRTTDYASNFTTHRPIVAAIPSDFHNCCNDIGEK